MLLVDHLMAKSGFNTHPLEDYVQGWDHSQLAAMYSRSEVKPSSSTAVGWGSMDWMPLRAHHGPG